MNVHVTNFLLSLLIVLFNVEPASAQAAAYTDPAQAYNKLLIDKDNGSYRQVGNFKVVGSPYLFGEKQKGSVFTEIGQSTNTILSYNTYTHEVEIYLNGNVSPLLRSFEEVDSFFIHQNNNGESMNLHFINASKSGFPGKGFLQVVSTGTNYILYKKYKCNLEYSSTNYVQSELRQFDLVYEYYAYNATTKTFKKLKLTSNALKKEFGTKADLPLLTNENLNLDPEQTLVQVFAVLNK